MDNQMALGVGATSSSISSMQLDDHHQIDLIKDKIEQLSITSKPPYDSETETQERVKFVNKARKEIDAFAQLLREVLKGSLKEEDIERVDVEILRIQYERTANHWYDAAGAVCIHLDCDSPPLVDVIRDSVRRVRRLLVSNQYPSLHDDLQSLQEVQVEFVSRYMDSSSDYSDCDSDLDGVGIWDYGTLDAAMDC